jgi:putative phage-type endonuclease
LGKATASRIADIIAKTKSGYSTSRDNYMAQLICERLTQTPTDGFTNSAMAWGTETEPLARKAYEALTFTDVVEVSMIDHPTIAMAGASPDGLVSNGGLVEIKCPNTATHIDTLLTQKVPSKYITQMQWQMACTDRLWCDFVSFDPRLPTHLQLFVKRIERDAEFILETEAEVKKFLSEVLVKITALETLK